MYDVSLAPLQVNSYEAISNSNIVCQERFHYNSGDTCIKSSERVQMQFCAVQQLLLKIETYDRSPIRVLN